MAKRQIVSADFFRRTEPEPEPQSAAQPEPPSAPDQPMKQAEVEVAKFPTLTCRVPPDQYVAFTEICFRHGLKPGYLLAWLVERGTEMIDSGEWTPPENLTLPGRKRNAQRPK